MQAIFFTSATVSQGTMLSLESKLAINCKNQKGSPVYLAALGLVDAAGPKHRERRLMEESPYFRVSPPVRTHEKNTFWQLEAWTNFYFLQSMPRNTIQASSREFWREVWTRRLFGRRYPRRKREVEDFSILNIWGAIQIVVWHTQLN